MWPRLSEYVSSNAKRLGKGSLAHQGKVDIEMRRWAVLLITPTAMAAIPRTVSS
jgi:hypothetical protein